MELRTRFGRKRQRTLTSDLPLTRFQAKRQKISTSNIPPTIRIRSSVSDMQRDFKIIIPRLNLDKYESKSTTTSCPPQDEHESVRLIEPCLFIPRVEIAALVDRNGRLKSRPIDETISREEESAKRSKSTSMKITEYKSVVADNVTTLHAQSLYTPKSDYNDPIIRERKSSKFDVDPDGGRQRILRDVKNVVESMVPLSIKLEKDDPVVRSLLCGQENTLSERSTRKFEKVKRFVDYETPLSKKSSQKKRNVTNTELFHRLKPISAKMSVSHCQFIKEEPLDEPIETCKIGKHVNFSFTAIQKNVDVQKTRTVPVGSSKLRSHRDETALTQELSVENVENVSLSQVDRPERSSSRRRSARNLAHMTNAKNPVPSKKTVVKFNNGSEPQLKSSQSNTSVSKKSFPPLVKIIEVLSVTSENNDSLSPHSDNDAFLQMNDERNSNDFPRFYNGATSQPIFRRSKSSLKSERKKKKLNVSFKEGVDIIDESLVESNLRKTMPVNDKIPITSTPCAFGGVVPSDIQDVGAEVPFYGFPASVDLSPHVGFCSFVLNTTLENIQRPVKFSQRLAKKRMERNLAAKSVGVRHEHQKLPSSFVLLNRLSEADISSYKITPLRGERTPLKSKTKYDYGIDDVNTDDSSDDEEDPKKTVPKWALLAKKNLKMFNPHEKIPRNTIQFWMKPPQLDGSSLRCFLFSKHKKR